MVSYLNPFSDEVKGENYFSLFGLRGNGGTPTAPADDEGAIQDALGSGIGDDILGALDLGGEFDIPTVSFDAEGMSPEEMLAAFLSASIEVGLGPENIGDVTNAANVLAGLNELENGNITFEDGRTISLDDFANADPFVQDQIRAEFNNRKIDLENQALNIRNQYRLSAASGARAAIAAENARRTQEFENRNKEFENKIALGEYDLTRAATEIERSLGGLAESRDRAKFEADVLQDSTPFGTVGGKTSFSSADLGGAVGALAKQAGIGDPNASLINFPGTITMNPSQMLAQQDANLGVSGAIPGLPAPTVGAGGIPTPPTLSGGYPTAGGLETPQPYQTVAPPTAAQIQAWAQQQLQAAGQGAGSGAPTIQPPQQIIPSSPYLDQFRKVR